MQATSALLIVGGLVVLVLGGEVLVRGAGGLARSLGMPALLVGLTVVAFATSAPELAVSLQATLGGNPGLAVGNVVGSNIANVLLVLGLSAVIAPLAVASSVVRRDVPVVVAVSLLTLVLCLDLRVGPADGLLLLAALVGYLVVTVVAARREELAPVRAPGAAEATAPSASEATALGAAEATALGVAPAAEPRRRLAVDGLLIGLGVALLVVGANWLVDGATQVARSWGVSDLVIGLTVVAIGTSLPELATSIVAAMRGQRDMAVGNLLGSCLFNLGAVLGLAALVAGDGIPVEPAAVRFDLPVMVAAAFALVPVAFTGLRIERWEGALFVGYYAAYLAFVVMTAVNHTALPAFGVAVGAFVIPLTVVTLAVLSVGELRRREPRTAS